MFSGRCPRTPCYVCPLTTLCLLASLPVIGAQQLFTESGSKILELSDTEFHRFVATGCSKLVLLYAHWCGHCVQFSPKYKALAEALGNDAFDEEGQSRLAAVDCAAYPALCRSLHVQGFPTLKHFKNGTEVSTYDLAEDLEGFARGSLGLSPVVAVPTDQSAYQTKSPLPEVDEYNSVVMMMHGESIFSREAGVTAAMRLFDGRLAFANLLETVVPSSGRGTLFSEKIRVLREKILPVVTASYPDPAFRRVSKRMLDLINTSADVDEGIWRRGLDLLFSKDLRLYPDKHWKHCRNLNCGLWQFLHGLTLGDFRADQSGGGFMATVSGGRTNSAVMACIRAIVAEFFQCDRCRKHFIEGYDKCVAGRCDMVNPDRKHTALWLWRFHNMVNDRTSREKGITGKDTTWPTKDECPQCRTVGAFDENQVYIFLRESYFVGGSEQQETAGNLQSNYAEVRSYRRRSNDLLYSDLFGE
ncbi:hypothetical protein Pmar_PMAR014094 [Perkinsus marinus ATCC 50983]|uniref:Sulfhydryl oxidase n=1 Tax=Perkinsus marinus (strain ATCC 50983 / TXsc) TaxID=423536 RepID=C5L2V6_PERM5|nr:hypothetical protein Pmar_PMAR014094 [Perkinsus marinus ATCC 50983]EER08929.1 hypothetical protein Pmar_PMAR014094 [Perkinsus marinus ATCC 50983]|eukprot:XP_002777113.1 hypothetical protein Pmar_PMAR014094 [Perkinsus marinus ATCC 50983]